MAENRAKLPLKIPEDQELQEKLRKRYAQYYELSRTKECSIDVSFLAKQLPYDFFSNVLQKDLHYIFNDEDFREQWGQSTVKLGLLVGEYLTEMAVAISRIKDKYKM